MKTGMNARSRLTRKGFPRLQEASMVMGSRICKERISKKQMRHETKRLPDEEGECRLRSIQQWCTESFQYSCANETKGGLSESLQPQCHQMRSYSAEWPTIHHFVERTGKQSDPHEGMPTQLQCIYWLWKWACKTYKRAARRSSGYCVKRCNCSAI